LILIEEKLSTQMLEIPDFVFTPKAEALATSIATVNLYQVLLGRDPENSFVIEENKLQRVDDLFRSFIGSNEFEVFVLSPIQNGIRLRHELTCAAPTFAQLDWLTSLIVFAPPQLAAIRGARSWRDFFCALLSIAVTAVDKEAAAASGPAGSLTGPATDALGTALDEIAEIQVRLDHLKSLIRGILVHKR
jgi:hypothetical protein